MTRVTIHVREEDEWLLTVVRRIVDGKTKMGLPKSSVSYELMRLAKNGYKKSVLGGDLPGADFDRRFGRDSTDRVD